MLPISQQHWSYFDDGQPANFIMFICLCYISVNVNITSQKCFLVNVLVIKITLHWPVLRHYFSWRHSLGSFSCLDLGMGWSSQRFCSVQMLITQFIDLIYHFHWLYYMLTYRRFSLLNVLLSHIACSYAGDTRSRNFTRNWYVVLYQKLARVWYKFFLVQVSCTQ